MPKSATAPKLSYLIDSRIDPASRPETAKYAPARESKRDPGRTRATTALEALAGLTGGKVWSAENRAELRQAFVSLLDEVRGRYLLRFEPTAVGTKGWHDLDVKVRGKGQVRARRGYHDGAP